MSDKLTSNGLGKEPTRSTADNVAITLASSQDSALEKVRGEAGQIIYAKWSKEKQQNASLGLLDAETTAQIKTEIQSVIDASNTAETLISSTTAANAEDITDAEKQSIVDASSVTWPTI